MDIKLFEFTKKKEKLDFDFTPKKFGPAFNWLGNNTINITLDGPGFVNPVFDIEKNIDSRSGHLLLFNRAVPIGHCEAEWDKNEMTVIWDVAVEEAYRGNRLASLMVKILTRELVFRQKTTRFKIRMLQLYKPDEKEIRLQNIGIGVIAQKLGLNCEYDLKSLLTANKIMGIDVLDPVKNIPPAYKISINTYPYVLIAFVTYPDNNKPVNDVDFYLRYRTDFDMISDWIDKGAMIAGNTDYLLRNDGIARFINCMANNQVEAQDIYQRIIGIEE